MPITFPHIFEDGPGHTASGVQVMENLNALRAAVEGVGESQVQTDAFQAGVLASTDWVLAGGSINSSTAALSYPATGGAAWLPAPVAGLVRTFTASAVLSGLVPPVRPGAGGYMKVGIELTASGAQAVVSIASGAEKGTEAEAIAAPPPTTSGKVRIGDVVIHNTAGVYSASAFRDRRPWAKGFYAFQNRRHGGIIESTSAELLPMDATNLSMRAECSGAPMRFTFIGMVRENTIVDLSRDTVFGFLIPENRPMFSGLTIPDQSSLGFQLDFIPPAGSSLFRPALAKGPGEATAVVNNATGTAGIQWSLQEILRPNVNNGTS